MDQQVSYLEMRRRAPLHFLAKADNARFTASLLWNVTSPERVRCAFIVGYQGSSGIATGEAFRREASLALELIVKAVIAQQIECRIAKKGLTEVRPTHNLATLWKDAQLPDLEKADSHRLLIATRILVWAGRYAAPLRDADFEREEADMARLVDTVALGSLRALQRRSLSWDDMDRIYGIAAERFWSIREESGR